MIEESAGHVGDGQAELTPFDELPAGTVIEKKHNAVVIAHADGRRVSAATFLEAWELAFPRS